MEREIPESFTLLAWLKEQQLLAALKPPIEDPKHWWWPNALSFAVVVGAILVQNTRWEQVAIALKTLQNHGVLSVESLALLPLPVLQEHLKHVGFFYQKSLRLQQLCQNILRDFGEYSCFCQEVDRIWLLAQRGIGFESADAILNYALGREIMVVDAYTRRLLGDCGYCFGSYEETQEWLMQGIIENYEKVCALYGIRIPLNLLFARFHGKIVEYVKAQRRRKSCSKAH